MRTSLSSPARCGAGSLFQQRLVQRRFQDAFITQIVQRLRQRVLGGLREYLLLCRAAGKRMVAMPSQVVDVAWHELILHTRL
ncbi:hypothetical protein KGZ13_33865, partial [Pseudomonas aeruginosa]|nr:hypothetical protein [Pseudomonas aeruginosa]